MLPELQGLSGGKKRMWNRLHRHDILSYLDKHGRPATLEQFGLKEQTLDDLLNESSDSVSPRMDIANRALAMSEISMEANRRTQRQVEELKEAYAQFVPAVAKIISDDFITPLLSLVLRLPKELTDKPAPDRLNMVDLFNKDGKL